MIILWLALHMQARTTVVRPPIVVPAIQEEYGDPVWVNPIDGTVLTVSPNPNVIPKRRTRWTCMDKHRVLLTTEDGAKICVLFDQTSSGIPILTRVQP